MVKDDKVDLALLPFGYTKERTKIVDYLMIGKREHGRIYIRNPRETFDWGVYTKPLRKEAWIAVLLAFLVLPIFMMITMFDCKILMYWLELAIISIII